MRKNDTQSSNTTCFVTGSMVLYTITPQSGIDHDFVSGVKILLKTTPTTPPFNNRHHTNDYVTCSKIKKKKKKQRNEFWRHNLTTRCAKSYDNKVSLRYINVKIVFYNRKVWKWSNVIILRLSTKQPLA
jgi:hypothetical protein